MDRGGRVSFDVGLRGRWIGSSEGGFVMGGVGGWKRVCTDVLGRVGV